MGFKFLKKSSATNNRQANDPTSLTAVGAAARAATSPPSTSVSTARAPAGTTTTTAAGRHHYRQPAATAASSSSGYTSAASDGTFAGSGFSGWEQPRSPAYIAAAARGGGTSSGGGSGGAGWDGRQHPPHQDGSQQQRTLWGRIRTTGKSNCTTSSVSSTATDASSDIERKRKAKGSSRSWDGMYMHSRPGTRVVGKYEILETLGTGYSGKVKKGRDIETGEYVALKVMTRVQQDDRRAPHKFRRLQEEIRAMKLCGDHPNTVGLRDHWFPAEYPKTDGTVVSVNLLVLDLCENGELFDLLYRGGPVPDFVCKEYFRQLMAGIKYCHDKGVWHRDLKPENLLLDRTFSLKIADFGFSASGRGNMLCNSIVGSKTYMGPEVLSRNLTGNPYHGGQADVWSAGVILFTMLCGHPPMEIAAETDWWFRALKLRRHDLFWQSHEKNAREPFSHVAKDLVNKMLATDPLERIQVHEILQHPYMVEPKPARSIPLLRYHHSRGGSGDDADVAQRVFDTMSERQRAALAAKRMCRVSPPADSRGTASSGASTGEGFTSPGTSPDSGTAARQHRHHATKSNDVFFADTYREIHKPSSIPWEAGALPPELNEADAAAVVGGFMANGRGQDVVEALERALLHMGAQIPALDEYGAGAINSNKSSSSKSISGRRRSPALRSSFKVSAILPEDETTGDGAVALIAKVYRVVPQTDPETEGGMSRSSEEREDARKMVVAIRRGGGDYYRYRMVEEALVTRMTERDSDKSKDRGGE